MRSRSHLPFSILLLIALVAAGLWWFGVLGGGHGTGRPQGRITISKETTFITEPLREDGYVDYLAAINQSAADGVSAEDNAAVALLEVVGPADVNPKVRDRFYALLGTVPLPEKGEYFVPFGSRFPPAVEKIGDDTDDGERQRRFYEQPDRGMERPWSKEEFPALAEWLAENDKPLDRAVRATRRPRCYLPLVCVDSSQPLVFAHQPCLYQWSDLSRALVVRAMFRLQAGRTEEARSDLMACHRMARLIGQAPTAISALTALNIDARACCGHAVLAHHGRLTAQQATRWADEISSLPCPVQWTEVWDRTGRFEPLESIAWMSRTNPDQWSGREDPGTRGALDALAAALAGKLVDWDEALRIVNAWQDRLVQAASNPEDAERAAALQQVEVELRAMAKTLPRDFPNFAGSFASGSSPRRVLGELLGQGLAFLTLDLELEQLRRAKRWEVSPKLACIALTLAAYRADHGDYPVTLDDLRPTYMAAVPLDPFSGKPLQFRCDGKDYTLYSVGPDGRDDGGRSGSYPDPNRIFPDAVVEYDDIAIRTSPAVESERKQP